MADKTIIPEKTKALALKIYKSYGIGCSKNCIAYDICTNHRVHHKRCINTISKRLLRYEEQSKIVEKDVKKCLKSAHIK